MLKNIIFWLFLISLLLVTHKRLVEADSTDYIPSVVLAATSTTPKPAPRARTTPKKEPTAYQLSLIESKAAEYGVSASLLKDVISCESGFNQYALGDNGFSRGLAQIHSGWHPEVTDNMAYDQEYAVDFLARYIAEGKGSQWTCYRTIMAGR